MTQSDDSRGRRIAFQESLTAIAEAMGCLGASDMGDLSRAQAALFHNATQMIEDLEEMLVDELTEISDPEG